MAIRESEIPKFLVSRRYISAMITFIVLFSALFLIIYEPFSLAVWFSTDDMLKFSFTVLFYVAAVIVLIISRSLMYALQDRILLTTIKYIWWIMSENLIISLLYTFITVRFFSTPHMAIPDIAIRALFCVTMILAIPNALVSFYAAFRSKCEELEASQYELQRLRDECRRLEQISERDMRLMSQVPQTAAERQPRMIHLYDYNGVLRLTINLDSLYYVESDDNYVKVFYKHNDRIASYMLRCRTKSLEQTLEGTGMIRCHRSYIVNVRKREFVGEENRMRYLVLSSDTNKRIPVSKSYYNNLLAALNTVA